MTLAARYFAMTMAIVALTAAPAAAQLSASMTRQIPSAQYVPRYTLAERAAAVQTTMHLPRPPMLDATVSLTPNAPYWRDGSHLSFWKPSYVIGTDAGGEAGVNFWNIYNGGHVNIGFASTSAAPKVLDCRMISAAPVAYKVYTGQRSHPDSEGRLPLHEGHFLLTVPATKAGDQVSVELWPATATTPVGFLGCEFGTYH